MFNSEATMLGLILNKVNGVSDTENSPIAARIIIFSFDILVPQRYLFGQLYIQLKLQHIKSPNFASNTNA